MDGESNEISPYFMCEFGSVISQWNIFHLFYMIEEAVCCLFKEKIYIEGHFLFVQNTSTWPFFTDEEKWTFPVLMFVIDPDGWLNLSLYYTSQMTLNLWFGLTCDRSPYISHHINPDFVPQQHFRSWFFNVYLFTGVQLFISSAFGNKQVVFGLLVMCFDIVLLHAPLGRFEKLFLVAGVSKNKVPEEGLDAGRVRLSAPWAVSSNRRWMTDAAALIWDQAVRGQETRWFLQKCSGVTPADVCRRNDKYSFIWMTTRFLVSLLTAATVH